MKLARKIALGYVANKLIDKLDEHSEDKDQDEYAEDTEPTILESYFTGNEINKAAKKLKKNKDLKLLGNLMSEAWKNTRK